MTPLPPDLRTLLAKAIQQARRVGESGARQALQSLAVDRSKPFDLMSLGDKSLRNRLRRRGRQAGDRHDRDTGTQNLGHLAHEVAYEHWHRMLFARFLAENGLLRDPEHGVDLSLDDCRDLAEEAGTDAWDFAGRCAGHMLPEIFRGDDPVLDLSLPPETRQELEGLVDGLPEAVFTAPDSLGWTYQFWQAERKEEVNRSGGKIGADELPAVTQLFTETYMVRFLLHNTIGAWRAGRLLADRPDLADNADDEERLRQLTRLDTADGYDFSYLRFVRGVREEDGDDERTGPWRPAAGSFPDWPSDAAALRVLDPCCGSGHFLVEAFELLVRLRMAEEGVRADEAIRRVLRDNLFGLEIDPRCTQIAAFNLALAAWRLAGEPIDLPPLNVACAGLAPNASEAEWRELAERAEGATGLPGTATSSGRTNRWRAVRSRRRWPRCTSCSGGPGARIAAGPGFRGTRPLQRRLQVRREAARHRDRARAGGRGTRRARRGGRGDGPGRGDPAGAVHACGHQRAVPGPGEAGARAAHVRGDAPRRRQGGSRHDVRVADLRVARQGRNAGGRVAAELVVPEDVPEAAGAVVEGADVEHGGAAG